MRVANWEGQELGRVSRWVEEKEGGREGEEEGRRERKGRREKKGERERKEGGREEEGRRKIGIEINVINIVFLFVSLTSPFATTSQAT